MTKLIASLGDRLLGALVPKVQASAACRCGYWCGSCNCGGNRRYRSWCCDYGQYCNQASISCRHWTGCDP